MQKGPSPHSSEVDCRRRRDGFPTRVVTGLDECHRAASRRRAYAESRDHRHAFCLADDDARHRRFEPMCAPLTNDLAAPDSTR
jgi:hypothetical protein